jgi:uncharacterized protein (DUF885 family)
MPRRCGTNRAWQTDPYQRYGGLDDEMLRAMRLVVDTGIHAKGWTRDQAIKYMLDNSAWAEPTRPRRSERYIAIPGQALAYKLGQLKILELRRKGGSRRSGPRFDIRAFTSRCLARARFRSAFSSRRSAIGLHRKALKVGQVVMGRS